MSDPLLVTVGRGYGISDTALAISMLEAAGIKVSAHPWHTVSLTWHKTHAFGGIELQVPTSQVEQAAAVLADFQITTRPKNRLFVLFVGIVVLIAIGAPPPASGFFAAVRPKLARIVAMD